jgi:hypothetical protein
MIEISNLLNNHISGDLVKKVGGSYFTRNGFENIRGFYHTFYIELWKKSNKYAIRVSDFNNNYYIQWPGSAEEFFSILDGSNDRNMIDKLKLFLDIINSREDIFGRKYGLI